jgi:molybdopterin/thiamine biosynthesis adenylyltransferase
MALDRASVRRYARQLVLDGVGVAGQERLQAAKVLVVGAGGLGAVVLPYLVAAGVGTVGVCEFDTLEISNLQRQVLYDTGHIGQEKQKLALTRLGALNPGVQLVGHGVFDEQNAKNIAEKYDFIVDASDNPDTRYLVDDTAVALGQRWVWGAAQAWEGMVSVFDRDCPLRRVFPALPADGGCAVAGAFGPLLATTGGLMAGQALKQALGLETLYGRLWIFDALHDQTRLLHLKPASIG